MSAFGKTGWQRGREHVRNLVADRARVDFIFRLNRSAGRGEICLTEIEHDFIARICGEHDKAVPDIHSGDRNICDSLRRKYQARLDSPRNLS